MFKNFIAGFFAFINAFAFGQNSDTMLTVFRQAENELADLHRVAFYSRNEAERIDANKKMLAAWDAIVSNPKILNYDFDRLKKDISILVPKNKRFKLITWNTFKNDGSYAYFGYLLVNNNKRIKKGFLKHETIEAYEYFKLLDRSATVKSPESYIGSADKWFGMLYTSLIDCDGFYTLIGWDGNDKITQRKFVDVLSFKSDGEPVFGKDVFKFPRKNPKRLMFEYSSEITMSLKYNDKRNQIVYSHLGPNQEGEVLSGQLQYYGPDGSYDALELKKDKWVVVEDVDARGDKNKNDRAEKPDPKKQTPIYKPK
ncbi:MAG: hypothetical protein V4635_12555 [Bacteroidota bacterium]